MNNELTHDQFTELKKEFVDFKINEMSREQMADWISTVYLSELDKCTEDEVKEEIDCYDDNLYTYLCLMYLMKMVRMIYYKSTYMIYTQTIGLTINELN